MTDGIHNPRGEWKMKDDTGSLIKYSTGDQVSKDGFMYVAVRDTMGFSPEHGDNGGWRKLNNSRIKEFTSGDTEPVYAQPGDEWFDTSKGILYKYIDDGNTKQWVSL